MWMCMWFVNEYLIGNIINELQIIYSRIIKLIKELLLIVST